MKPWYAYLFAIVSMSAHAAADCPDFSALDVSEDPVAAFDQLRRDDKLGAAACSTPLCNAITEWERQAPSDSQDTPCSRATRCDTGECDRITR